MTSKRDVHPILKIKYFSFFTFTLLDAKWFEDRQSVSVSIFLFEGKGPSIPIVVFKSISICKIEPPSNGIQIDYAITFNEDKLQACDKQCKVPSPIMPGHRGGGRARGPTLGWPARRGVLYSTTQQIAVIVRRRRASQPLVTAAPL